MEAKLQAECEKIRHTLETREVEIEELRTEIADQSTASSVCKRRLDQKVSDLRRLQEVLRMLLQRLYLMP